MGHWPARQLLSRKEKGERQVLKQVDKEPARAWIVVFAGVAVNLCLGILYAWSVWKKVLVDAAKANAGEVMTGINAGWPYLTDAQGTVAYFLCGLTFAVFMIPGGRFQDKFGPRTGVTLGGLSLAAGCIVAGLLKSYVGLIIGYGILGGIGMGLGYAAATPAALKWFAPHRRGLIAGIVVAGYGGAAIYIAPLGQYLIDNYGISGSFIGLGIIFAIVVVVAGQLISEPPAGYVPPGLPVGKATVNKVESAPAFDYSPTEMLRTWQYYVLVLMFIGSAQSGLLVIANAAPLLAKTAGTIEFFAENAWIIAAYGGLINALGRIGSGFYSDRIGRVNTYTVNLTICALFLLAMPYIISAASVPLLFLATGIAYWQYGGGLSIMPALTSDLFGTKNLGVNYGLVFLGWGLGFMMPLLAGYIKDITGSYSPSFYSSAVILIVAVILSRFLRKPAK